MKTLRDRLGFHSASERGVGLIEIVVAMLLFGLLAVSFLPLLIMAVKTAGQNAAIATASQLAGQELEQIRAGNANCADVQAYNGARPASTDDRAVVYVPEVIVDTCPGTYPAVISVQVRVWNTTIGNPDGPLATATTLVRLDAATP